MNCLKLVLGMVPLTVFLVGLSTGWAAQKDKPDKPKVQVIPYAEVRKNIEKHVGKRVTWIGKEVSTTFSESDDKEGRPFLRCIFVAKDKQGKFFADTPFVVDGNKLTKTAAAKKADSKTGDSGIRRITGTIQKSQEVKLSDGNTIQAPVLVEVTISMSSEKVP
jgi:hypothetical protein